MLGEGDEVGVPSSGWHLLAPGIQRVMTQWSLPSWSLSSIRKEGL